MPGYEDHMTQSQVTAQETSFLRSIVGLLRIMRPKQWTKNVLVYAGLVFDGQLFVVDSFIRVTISFVLLCLVASSIYIINDIADIEKDRQHPTKRWRPLPSGQISVGVARIAAIILPIFSIGAAFLYSPPYALVLIIYFILHVAYSWRLKHIVLIDILAITAGYVLRVAGGVIVIQVAAFSPWLYACTALLALFLAIGKRRQELILLGEDRAGNIRQTFKEYNLPLLDDMLRFVTTSTFIAYTLYTIEAPSAMLAGTNLALLTVPFVLFALFRYLYLIHVKGVGSAPDEVLLRDVPLLASIILWGLTFVLIIYTPH
jgi:4-hydroxybenzoate polyprenyltransferase